MNRRGIHRPRGRAALTDLSTASELLYVFTALVLGMRLAILFLTRSAPTGLLAVALLFGGAPVHALTLLVSTAGFPPSAGFWSLAYALLIVSGGVASTCVMQFSHEVFAPRRRWLPALAAVLACFYALVAVTVPFSGGRPRETPLGVAFFAVVATVFVWASAEGFRCWARYRRTPGLDPLVVERFRLWAVATSSQVVVVALTLASWGDPVVAGASAAMGLISSVALWLAFLPPRWFASWLRRERLPLSGTHPVVP